MKDAHPTSDFPSPPRSTCAFLLTLLVAALGVRGVVRADRWVERRHGLPGWRIAVRQLPQLVFPTLAAVLFFGLTLGARNAATPVDAYGLWPAATTMVLVAGMVGSVLVPTRTITWIRRTRPHR